MANVVVDREINTDQNSGGNWLAFALIVIALVVFLLIALGAFKRTPTVVNVPLSSTPTVTAVPTGSIIIEETMTATPSAELTPTEEVIR